MATGQQVDIASVAMRTQVNGDMLLSRSPCIFLATCSLYPPSRASFRLQSLACSLLPMGIALVARAPTPWVPPTPRGRRAQGRGAALRRANILDSSNPVARAKTSVSEPLL